MTKKRTSMTGTRSAMIEKSVAQRQAEILLLESGAKFSGDGLGRFLGDHFQAGGESVTGANGAAEKVESFGETFFEICVQTARAHQGNVPNRSEPAHRMPTRTGSGQSVHEEAG